MTLKEIHEKLNSLITNDSSDEFIVAIGEINKDLDDFQEKYNEDMNKANDMRTKYIDLIQSGNFGASEKSDVSEPRSLEQIIQETISQKS